MSARLAWLAATLACAAALHPWLALFGQATRLPRWAELGVLAAGGMLTAAARFRTSRPALTALLAASGTAGAVWMLMEPGARSRVLPAVSGLPGYLHAFWLGIAEPAGGGAAAVLGVAAAILLARPLAGLAAGRARWERCLLPLALGFSVQWGYTAGKVPVGPFTLAYAALLVAAATAAAPPAAARRSRASAAPQLAAGLAFAVLASSLALALPRDRSTVPWPWLESATLRLLPFTDHGPEGGFGRFAGRHDPWNPRVLGGRFLPDPRPLLTVTVVQPEGRPLPPVLYLRGPVYVRYTGRSWQKTRGPLVFGSLPAEESPYPDPDPLPVDVTVRSERVNTSVLYAPLVPRRVETELTVGYYEGTLDLRTASERLEPGQSYRVVADLPTPEDDEIRAAWEEVRRQLEAEGILDWRQGLGRWDSPAFLELPASPGVRRVARLAHELTADARDPLEAAYRLRDFLRTLPYNTDMPALPAGDDFVEFFLFEHRQGYCTAFASALAVMLRSVGIPARYVEGFVVHVTGPGTYSVTGAQAHAWVEALIPGYGWLPLEATPPFPAVNLPADEAEQRPEGGGGVPAGVVPVPTPGNPPQGTVGGPQDIGGPEEGGAATGGGARQGHPALPAGAAALLAAAAALVAKRRRASVTGEAAVRAHYARMRALLEIALADGPQPVPARVLPSLTPSELLAAVEARWPGLAAAVGPLTTAYERTVYAGACQPISAADLARWRRTFRAALMRELGLRGLLRLRVRAFLADIAGLGPVAPAFGRPRLRG